MTEILFVYWAAPVLAQVPADREQAFWTGAAWLIGIILVFSAGAAVAGYLKRRADRAPRADAEEFTLERLRELRRRGQLTDAEYKALRDKVIDGEMSA